MPDYCMKIIYLKNGYVEGNDILNPQGKLRNWSIQRL